MNKFISRDFILSMSCQAKIFLSKMTGAFCQPRDSKAIFGMASAMIIIILHGDTRSSK